MRIDLEAKRLPELQFSATLIALIKRNFVTALACYLKRIKLVGVAFALVFLANLGWGQLAASGGAKPHCTMTALHTDANTLHDCCKYPCYTKAATQVPILLGSVDIALAVIPVELPHRR